MNKENKATASIRNVVEEPWQQFPGHFGGALSKALVRPENVGSRLVEPTVLAHELRDPRPLGARNLEIGVGDPRQDAGERSQVARLRGIERGQVCDQTAQAGRLTLLVAVGQSEQIAQGSHRPQENASAPACRVARRAGGRGLESLSRPLLQPRRPA